MLALKLVTTAQAIALHYRCNEDRRTIVQHAAKSYINFLGAYMLFKSAQRCLCAPTPHAITSPRRANPASVQIQLGQKGTRAASRADGVK